MNALILALQPPTRLPTPVNASNLTTHQLDRSLAHHMIFRIDRKQTTISTTVHATRWATRVTRPFLRTQIPREVPHHAAPMLRALHVACSFLEIINAMFQPSGLSPRSIIPLDEFVVPLKRLFRCDPDPHCDHVNVPLPRRRWLNRPVPRQLSAPRSIHPLEVSMQDDMELLNAHHLISWQRARDEPRRRNSLPINRLKKFRRRTTRVFCHPDALTTNPAALHSRIRPLPWKCDPSTATVDGDGVVEREDLRLRQAQCGASRLTPRGCCSTLDYLPYR